MQVWEQPCARYLLARYDTREHLLKANMQIYLFKPVQMNISSVFLLLLIYSCGIAWAALMPRREHVVGTRFEFLGPAIHFINPGKLTIKEAS